MDSFNKSIFIEYILKKSSDFAEEELNTYPDDLLKEIYENLNQDEDMPSIFRYQYRNYSSPQMTSNRIDTQENNDDDDEDDDDEYEDMPELISDQSPRMTSNRINVQPDNIMNIIFGMVNGQIPIQNTTFNIINQQDVIMKLPENEYDELKKYIKGVDYNEDNECNICLDKYVDNEMIVELKCKHLFHDFCIYSWLSKQSYKCPVCRMEQGNPEKID